MKSFENPDCLPLEDLELSVKNDGVICKLSALSEEWAEKRYFLCYEQPKIYDDNDGSVIIGAENYWMEIVNYIIEDLNWLLNLPFYRFWSNIVYNTSIIDTLISFLQAAPPFYDLENFPTVPTMLEALEKLRRNVLMVFARVITNKESSMEYMSLSFFGNLLYDNYIITIPIIFDLCQLYGRENAKVVEKILNSIFILQPLYNDDLQKCVPCLIEAFRNVEQKLENCPSNTSAPTMPSIEEKYALLKTTYYILEDLILYILDISSTLTILLRIYSPIIATFHREDFTNKIVSIYGNTIPQMYKMLDELSTDDENMPKYIELKHRLDVTRVEMLNLYRMIIYEPILNIQKRMNELTETEIRNYTEEYLNTLMNAICEKEFIVDYHQFYPIDVDLDSVSKLCSEFDSIKCEYILRSLHASIEDSMISTTSKTYNNATVTIAGPSNIQNNQLEEHFNDINYVKNKVESVSNDPDKIISLISEVKDILCDYGEGFIQLCLKHYNYAVESVINAVLEDTLPSHLKELDNTLPYIPPDPMEVSAAVDLAIGVQRLNVFDNDEFDVMTRDVIDTSKIHQGKKKEEYKDINEMLNDKSKIKTYKNIYEKYSIVDSYDDEYDDTYGSHDICANEPDDPTEIDSRSFTTSRILYANDEDESTDEDNTEIEDKKLEKERNDHFIRNPAELRAKIEQQKQLAKGSKNDRDKTGKLKSQGQDKDVSASRQKKNAHKSSQGYFNNRRKASQMKKRQGMIPS